MEKLLCKSSAKMALNYLTEMKKAILEDRIDGCSYLNRLFVKSCW
jgi:hypothetical protein